MPVSIANQWFLTRRCEMKTSELQGPALDWAVAKCEGRREPELLNNFATAWFTWGNVHYSTDWAHGGPIIERERITLEHLRGAGDTGADVWVAMLTCEDKKFGGVECFEEQGPTALVAAMRCYVASKLGDEVEIPEELR
jgi:hypothetical protein